MQINQGNLEVGDGLHTYVMVRVILPLLIFLGLLHVLVGFHS